MDAIIKPEEDGRSNRDAFKPKESSQKWWELPFPGETLLAKGVPLPMIDTPKNESPVGFGYSQWTLLLAPGEPGKVSVVAACPTGDIYGDPEVDYDTFLLHDDIVAQMNKRGLKDYELREVVSILTENEKDFKSVEVQLEQLTGGKARHDYIKLED